MNFDSHRSRNQPVEEISLVYAPINTTRVKLRVAGNLA
ncbi:hypothetical protein OENI_340020 [Oenococcus oeni]|nr:hypothetical protein OENI_340020 [Oenococcus oeni]